MSKNLVKSYLVTKESSVPRVIDGNITVEQSLERIKYIFPEVTADAGAGDLLSADADADANGEAGFSELDPEMVKGLVDDDINADEQDFFVESNN